jgi:hypothetical protein
MIHRREFLAASAAASLMALAPRSTSQACVRPTAKKKVAFLGTVVHQHSHAQHFLDRLAVGYTWGGKWHEPPMELASVYIDQFPESDLGKARIAKYKLKQFGSIADALTLGGDKLAVDGVVIIAEHGDYPANEKGQRLYPRYAWFKEVVKVFEASGRSVPVFNDKHLSTSWSECAEMVADSKRLDFAFLAGSSLPVTWRLPSIDMPYGADLTESVCVAYGGVDSYDFHALETAQCMSERRKGGEVGVRSMQALRNEKLWALLDGKDRARTRQLMVAALNRSHNLPVDGGFPTGAVTYEWAKQALPNTTGYFMEHFDGFRTSIFMTGIQDFNYAGYRKDTDEIVSCQMYLPMPTHGSTTADFFNPLSYHIEQTILNGKASYPVERTLLTSGMVIGGVDSLHQSEVAIDTPHLKVAYQSPDASFFWRD